MGEISEMPTHYEYGVFSTLALLLMALCYEVWMVSGDGCLMAPLGARLLLHSPWEKHFFSFHVLNVSLYEAWSIAFAPATVHL